MSQFLILDIFYHREYKPKYSCIKNVYRHGTPHFIKYMEYKSQMISVKSWIWEKKRQYDFLFLIFQLLNQSAESAAS